MLLYSNGNNEMGSFCRSTLRANHILFFTNLNRIFIAVAFGSLHFQDRADNLNNDIFADFILKNGEWMRLVMT